MANIFDYLTDVQYDSFYDLPLNELDVLALTELTYLPFDNLLDQPVNRLSDVATRVPRESTMLTNKERLQLLDQLAQHKRFRNCKLSNFINEIDTEQQKQFAAMTYRLNLDTYLIVFRGTDDSIIGWKEDFHMTYMEHVPAQQTAVHYVQKVMKAFPKATFILTGHSKGGNLATYASSQVEPALQDRIKQIYSFDAPGLNHTIIETEGYQSIASKIKRYIPQGSIVGMMLETPKQAHIVKSVAIGGIAQHDTFSWQIENKHFVLLNTLNPDSIQTDKTLKEWVETVPDDELKNFFDVFFGLILDAQITSIDDFFQPNSIKKLLTIVQNAHALTEQEKEMLNRLTRLLISIRYQTWIDDFKTPNPATFMTDMRGNWASLAERFSFLNKDE